MKLTKKEAKPFLDMSFPEYTGRKFRFYTSKTCAAQLYWCEGRRDNLVALRWNGQNFVKSVAPDVPPFYGGDVSFDIPTNVFIVRHVYFGSDQWIEIIAHPDNDMVPKMLQ